ncbi:MAG: hypothetical protein ACPG4U_17430, partial [Pseudomonadales bacterium]
LYNAKTVLNYAAYEAARIGAVNYSHPEAMKLALAQKLAALEPVPDEGNAYDTLVAQQEAFLAEQGAFNELVKREGQPVRVACIRRVNPPADSKHFQTNTLAPGTSKSIVNDHLLFRDATPVDGMSVQDANLLKISVTYCPKMIVPIVSTAIKRLMLTEYHEADPDPIEGWEVPKTTPFEQQCYQNNRFPMVAQALIRMQTPVGQYDYSDDDCE